MTEIGPERVEEDGTRSRVMQGQMGALTPRARGHGSSCDTRLRLLARRGPGEDLDAPEGACPTAGAKVQALRQKIEEGLYGLVA